MRFELRLFKTLLSRARHFTYLACRQGLHGSKLVPNVGLMCYHYTTPASASPVLGHDSEVVGDACVLVWPLAMYQIISVDDVLNIAVGVFIPRPSLKAELNSQP